MDVSIKLSISRLKWYEKSVLVICSNVGIQNSFKIRKKEKIRPYFPGAYSQSRKEMKVICHALPIFISELLL